MKKDIVINVKRLVDIANIVCVCIIITLIYTWFPWKNSIKGYTKTGQYILSVRLDRRDAYPAIYKCRQRVHMLGGGYCTVPAHSLVLKDRSITLKPFPDVFLKVVEK